MVPKATSEGAISPGLAHRFLKGQNRFGIEFSAASPAEIVLVHQGRGMVEDILCPDGRQIGVGPDRQVAVGNRVAGLNDRIVDRQTQGLDTLNAQHIAGLLLD